MKLEPPPVDEWIDIIHKIYVMEKLSSALRTKSKWTDYIEPIRSDILWKMNDFYKESFPCSTHIDAVLARHLFCLRSSYCTYTLIWFLRFAVWGYTDFETCLMWFLGKFAGYWISVWIQERAASFLLSVSSQVWFLQ